MIKVSEAKRIARQLHDRLEPSRAIVLIASKLQKALFAGHSDRVVFWALVHAHYNGGDLSDTAEEELSLFSDFIERDPSDLN